MKIPRYILIFALLLSFVLPCSCGEELINSDDPSNLVVQITVSQDGSGDVLIQANADNTVEYQLRIGVSTDPTATSITGIFEYTFTQPGYYQIEVRAYGVSGRYIKESRQVMVDLGNDIPIGDGYSSPLSYEGYNLVWNDEFDGTTINSNNWVFETGTGNSGWGNNELQYYRQENAWVGDGVLTIEARAENYLGRNYTSARMKTQSKVSFKYGRVDIRALLPKGQGLWPALWMLGNNITSVGWPACGEIDIMEMIGGNNRENTVHGTVHWDLDGHVQAGGSYSLTSGTFANHYHVFSIIWSETSIKWLVNNTQYYEINITPAQMTEFHQNFFLIFNVAVGGNWPGNPDATTVFPQRMKVDYIRVFQLK